MNYSTWKEQVAQFMKLQQQVKAECSTSEGLRALVAEYKQAIGQELAAMGCSAEDAISWKAKRLLQGAL